MPENNEHVDNSTKSQLHIFMTWSHTIIRQQIATNSYLNLFMTWLPKITQQRTTNSYLNFFMTWSSTISQQRTTNSYLNFFMTWSSTITQQRTTNKPINTSIFFTTWPPTIWATYILFRPPINLKGISDSYTTIYMYKVHV